MATVSVRKRQNSWQCRVYLGMIDGKPVRIEKSGFRTQKAAKAAADRVISERVSHPKSPDKNKWQGQKQQKMMTYSEYLDFWFDNYCLNNLKQTTQKGYAKKIDNYIRPRLGKIPLDRITPMDLRNLINEMFNEGYSRNELASVKGILTGSLRYAVSPAGFFAGYTRQLHQVAEPVG